MAKTQAEKRIDLIKEVKQDETKVSVGFACEVFAGTVFGLDKKSQTFKRIKDKVTEGEWIAFLHSLLNSYTSSLYCNAAPTKEEQIRRVKIVAEANKDLAIGKWAKKGLKK